MRRNAKVDVNQGDIVDALRAVGAKVEPLHQVGGGVPDLLVSWRGDLWLLEVKVPGGKLTPKQQEWHAVWRCDRVRIVTSVDQALRAIGAIT